MEYDEVSKSVMKSNRYELPRVKQSKPSLQKKSARKETAAKKPAPKAGGLPKPKSLAKRKTEFLAGVNKIITQKLLQMIGIIEDSKSLAEWQKIYLTLS